MTLPTWLNVQAALDRAEEDRNAVEALSLTPGHEMRDRLMLAAEILRVRDRIEALLNAEEIVLRSPLSRQERACHKATRDAYALVLDMMSEGAE